MASLEHGLLRARVERRRRGAPREVARGGGGVPGARGEAGRQQLRTAAEAREGQHLGSSI